MIVKDAQNYSDAHFQAMIGKSLVHDPHDLRCGGKKTVSRLCVNPNCTKLSLLCSDSGCPECQEDTHEQCPLIKLKGVTAMLNKQINSQKQAIIKISEAEDKFINQLRKTNIPLEESNCFKGLEDDDIKIAEDIYKEKNAKILRGKEASKFYKKVKMLSESFPSRKLGYLLNTYEQKLKDVLTEILQFKKKINLALSNSNDEKRLDMESAIFSNQVSLKTGEMNFLMNILNKSQVTTSLAPPEISPQVMETLDRQKFFQNEINAEKNPKVVNFGQDYFTGAIGVSGKPSGFGRLFKKTGGVYIGWFSEGKAEGKGAYVFPNGSFYEGQFHQNKATTKNGKFCSDDMSYEGGFKNNKFHGQAYERGNGYRFEGTYDNGARQEGRLRWNTQSGQYIYEGTFNSQSQFHGKGVLQEPKGKYEGSFANGEKNGEFAVYVSDNGTRYEGSYVNGFREGFGTIFNYGGEVAYKGEHKKGFPHGEGSVFQDGKQIKTTWIDGIDSRFIPKNKK